MKAYLHWGRDGGGAEWVVSSLHGTATKMYAYQKSQYSSVVITAKIKYCRLSLV